MATTLDARSAAAPQTARQFHQASAAFLRSLASGRACDANFEAKMRVQNRLVLATALLAAALLAAPGIAAAQTNPPAYQGCEVGALVTLRQEVSNESGVTLGEDYVELRCDGWNWTPVR
jgi:hypothetical protein